MLYIELYVRALLEYCKRLPSYIISLRSGIDPKTSVTPPLILYYVPVPNLDMELLCIYLF